MADTFTLCNGALRLEFNRRNGSLVGLCALQTGWKILDRPQLGLSFRLMVPLPGRRNNPVFGEKQKLTNITIASDHRAAEFLWDGVKSEFGGSLEIKLTLAVTLTQRQTIYSMTINNQSDHIVENVYCPYVGDIRRPSDEKWFRTFAYRYAAASETSLWPTFPNLRGYYGVDYPTQMSPESPSVGAPMSPFILLRGAKQGLYVGVSTPQPELVAWHLELRPGYDSSIDEHVPPEPTISGKDVSTRFAAVHVPFIMPGEEISLSSIALEAFQGGWQQGVDIYKDWRNSWMTMPRVPAWIKEPHSWQQVQINSPEDELRMGFRDLVKIGQDCARYGVKAIQLVGWNKGGQDQNNPSHEPDPRLGTFEELKAAIAKIQSLGVKLILFSKFTWADRSTDRFRKELIRQAIKDPYGDYYHYQGYQYETPTQLLDINTKRLIPMCFLSEEYLRICSEEFQKVLSLNPDGILFDECLHHSPALLCFDKSHGHRYGASVYANDRKLIRNFDRLARSVGKEFLFSGEACYDWEFEVYHLSYHRSGNKEHIPLTRYMMPDVPLMSAVTGFNDRNMINQCLMYRYIISYEPYNFKGRLDDFPLTLAYGNKMDALRTELRGYFWDGEFRHEMGARVTERDQPYRPYAVFLNRNNGRIGVVVANYDESKAVTVRIKLDDGGHLGRYRLVEDSEWKVADYGITIPPCSAAAAVP